MQEKMDVVVPLAPDDVHTFLKGVSWIEKYLPVKRIIIIGNDKVKEMIDFSGKINFINENELIPYQLIHNIIADIADGNVQYLRRTGWYLQQFLKMQYAYLCEDDYYLIWDGDSIPTHTINFFKDGRPVLGLKRELCKAYFITMNRLLPGLKKSTKLSYISEHMVISVPLMKELIGRIEANGLSGKPFYECILRKIDREVLNKSGFSEFETYGTFCKVFYPGKYAETEWHSIRPANYFWDIDKLTEDDMYWISKGYEAISFEFYATQDNKKYVIKCLQSIFQIKLLKKIFPARVLCAPVEVWQRFKHKRRKE